MAAYTRRGSEGREGLKRPHEEDPPPGTPSGEGGRPPKRQRIDGEERLTRLISKVGDREDQLVSHLTGLTEVLPKDIPQHYIHITNQIMKGVFLAPHKIVVYSTLSGLLAARCSDYFADANTKGKDLGKRILRLTMEMLDINLVDGVWWKTMVMIKFASDLVHARVLHPQNMWNILREIVDEVLSVNNSANRRNGYCYMALSALEIIGARLRDFDADLRKQGKKLAADPQTTSEETPGGEVIQHREVDFAGLYDDISYYMRNRTKRDHDPDSRVVQCWNEIERLRVDNWRPPPRLASQPQPYREAVIEAALPVASLSPICTLRRMRERGLQSAAARGENTPEKEEQTLQQYIQRIGECQARGDCDDAFRMWKELPQLKVNPTVEAYQAIMSVCVDKGNTERAQQYFDSMLGDGLSATVTAYNILMETHARASDPRLFDIFQQLKHSTDLQPDITTFNIVCGGCATLDRPDVALGLLDEMATYSVPPDQNFFATVIRNCRLSADPRQAADLFIRFTSEYRLEPNKAVYVALESVFAESAERALKQGKEADAAAEEANKADEPAMEVDGAAGKEASPTPAAAEGEVEGQPDATAPADAVEAPTGGDDAADGDASGDKEVQRDDATSDPTAATTEEGSGDPPVTTEEAEVSGEPAEAATENKMEEDAKEKDESGNPIE